MIAHKNVETGFEPLVGSNPRRAESVRRGAEERHRECGRCTRSWGGLRHRDRQSHGCGALRFHDHLGLVCPEREVRRLASRGLADDERVEGLHRDRSELATRDRDDHRHTRTRIQPGRRARHLVVRRRLTRARPCDEGKHNACPRRDG